MMERYLDSLRERLAWRSDRDDLISEIQDHLSASIDRLEAEGMDRGEAERLTLERFGDPDEVVRGFARAAEGGLAVPTRFTRTGGTVALVAAGLWLLVVAFFWAAGLTPGDNEGLNGTTASIAYGIGALALLVASPLTIVVMVALAQRSGGLGLFGTAGLLIASIGALGSLAAWVMIGWGSFGSLGLLLFGGALLNRDVAPRTGALALTASLAAGGLVWALAHAVGSLSISVGFWGDDWLANEIGLTTGVSLLAFALFVLGRWLRSEEPAPIDLTSGPMTA
jgi:hypothetical protein